MSVERDAGLVPVEPREPKRSMEALLRKPARWPGIRVKSPLIQVIVTDEDRDGVYMVSDTFSTVYGAGETVEAALGEYIENLYYQFDELDRDEAQLGVRLRAELHALREYFAREI